MNKKSHKVKQNLITALDIGTSKIYCLIAQIEPNQKLKIIGMGHHCAQGVKAGAIIDIEEATHSISSAVHDAEQSAGETIKDVIVNISSGKPVSKMIETHLQINGREIETTDIKNILEISRYHPLSDDRTLIHSIPIDYNIDGNSGIKDPCGMFAQKIEANIHIITAATSAIRNLATCISRAHLNISAGVLSSYASGLSCLTKDERELGVTLIDLGAGSTKISIFSDNKLIFTDTIPIGGNHITNDIARGLGTPVAHAERLKTLHGHALSASFDENIVLDVPQIGEDQYSTTGPISKSILVGIIQPRVEEIFELVRNRFKKNNLDKISGRHVALTGGASLMPGIRDVAAMILNKQVRMARPSGFSGTSSNEMAPSYSTVCGLLNYAFQNKNILSRHLYEMPTIKNSFFDRFKKIFVSKKKVS